MDIEKDAKALLDNAKKKNAEAKGAAKGSSPKNQKTKEEREKEEKAKAEEAAKAEQAEKDKGILSKKEEELNEDEKKRKDELVDIKKKEDEKILSTPDDRLDNAGKKHKAELKAQKPSKLELRVHKLVDEIDKLKKDKEKSADKDTRIKGLEGQLADIQKNLSMTPDDLFNKKVKEEGILRISKQIEEDKDKPREERREMSDEELNEWLGEDLVAAQRWIGKNTLKRTIEEDAYREMIIDAKRRKELSDKQKPYMNKVLAKHPELSISEREKALEAEGKKPKEIHEILMGENEKYRIVTEIVKENPKKYLNTDNGPELVEIELEKRLSGAGTKKEETSKLNELEKKLTEVTAELERVKNLDVGITSNRSSEKKEESEMDKKLSNLATEVGLDSKKVADRVKTRTAKGYGR